MCCKPAFRICIFRTIFDNPVHLPIGDFLHCFCTSKIPGWRNHIGSFVTLPISCQPVTMFAGQGLGPTFKENLSFFQILCRGFQGILHVMNITWRAMGFPGLRACSQLGCGLNSRCDFGDFPSPLNGKPSLLKKDSADSRTRT